MKNVKWFIVMIKTITDMASRLLWLMLYYQVAIGDSGELHHYKDS
jgi:hypothetical protein